MSNTNCNIPTTWTWARGDWQKTSKLIVYFCVLHIFEKEDFLDNSRFLTSCVFLMKTIIKKKKKKHLLLSFKKRAFISTGWSQNITTEAGAFPFNKKKEYIACEWTMCSPISLQFERKGERPSFSFGVISSYLFWWILARLTLPEFKNTVVRERKSYLIADTRVGRNVVIL